MNRSEVLKDTCAAHLSAERHRACEYQIDTSGKQTYTGTDFDRRVRHGTARLLPHRKKLTISQQRRLTDGTAGRSVKKGTVLHSGDADCTGLLLVRRGQLRAYILSDEGREITIYRLFERDICLFSASCIIRSIQFEVMIEAEKDTDLWVIPLMSISRSWKSRPRWPTSPTR